MTTLSKEQLLEELGLSKNDAKTYLALLREGASSVMGISKKTSVHRANVYGALERLKVKGLVSEQVNGTKRTFKAADPSLLITLLHEKELRLKTLLPQFQLDYQLAGNESVVEVFEGGAALRNLFQHYVQLGKDIYAYGLPRDIIDVIGEHFQNVIHEKRIKQKQSMYHIYNSDAKERMQYLNALEYTEARSLDPEFDCPVATLVCGEEVSIVSVHPEKTTIIVIRNPEMASVYRKYFDILWEKAKKK